jgi:acetylornithine deacetylase
MADPRWPLVLASLERLAPRYREVLSALVAYPSVVGDEAPAQRFLRDVCADAGLTPELYTVDPQALQSDPRAGLTDLGREPRPNLVAVLRGSGGGRSLALSGHVDVVPIGERGAWSRDPFSGHVEGDRLHGRGALDMKGGLVAALHAVAALRASGIPLRGDVWFESVIEEEATGNGALAARLREPQPDAAIIPELSGEAMLVATPGVLWAELTTTGRSAYVGRAGAAVNAIDVMLFVLERLRSLPDELNAGFRHPVFADSPAPLTLNVGTIEGGDWPSSVPLACRAGIRFSFPIGWSVTEAKELLRDRLRMIAADHPWLREHPPAIRWHGFQAEGWSIEPGAPIVEALSAAIRDETRAPAATAPLFGTADARFFRDAGVPAIYYGPSGEGQHGPDEWVDLASVARVTRVLARAALAWCG